LHVSDTADYDSIALTVTFRQGQNNSEAMLIIHGDDAVEENETVTLSLSVPSFHSPRITAAEDNVTTAIIIDTTGKHDNFR